MDQVRPPHRLHAAAAAVADPTLPPDRHRLNAALAFSGWEPPLVAERAPGRQPPRAWDPLAVAAMANTGCPAGRDQALALVNAVLLPTLRRLLVLAPTVLPSPGPAACVTERRRGSARSCSSCSTLRRSRCSGCSASSTHSTSLPPAAPRTRRPGGSAPRTGQPPSRPFPRWHRGWAHPPLRATVGAWVSGGGRGRGVAALRGLGPLAPARPGGGAAGAARAPRAARPPEEDPECAATCGGAAAAALPWYPPPYGTSGGAGSAAAGRCC
jgi:hypothetical protein